MGRLIHNKISNNSFTNLSHSNFTKNQIISTNLGEAAFQWYKINVTNYKLIFCLDSFQNKQPRFIPDAFIMAAAKQAIKFTPSLKEIRLHLCQKCGICWCKGFYGKTLRATKTCKSKISL